MHGMSDPATTAISRAPHSLTSLTLSPPPFLLATGGRVYRVQAKADPSMTATEETDPDDAPDGKGTAKGIPNLEVVVETQPGNYQWEYGDTVSYKVKIRGHRERERERTGTAREGRAAAAWWWWWCEETAAAAVEMTTPSSSSLLTSSHLPIACLVVSCARAVPWTRTR